MMMEKDKPEYLPGWQIMSFKALFAAVKVGSKTKTSHAID